MSLCSVLCDVATNGICFNLTSFAEVSSANMQNPALSPVRGQAILPPAEDRAENVQTEGPHMPVVGKTLPGPAEDVKMSECSVTVQ